MKKLLILFGFIAFWTDAFSCTCTMPGSVEKELDKSDVVFKGRVISSDIMEVKDSLITSFQVRRAVYKLVVSRVFKGDKKQDTITIVTGVGHGDCGYQFQVGESYIVYGYFQSRHSPHSAVVEPFLSTNICTRTRLASDKDELKALKKKTRCRKDDDD